jgi:hypothetical protein
MNVQKKIFISAFSVIACLVFVSAGIGMYVARETSPNPAQATETTENDGSPKEIAAKPFHLNEGYSLALVDGWELISHTPDRQVDRYRFERQDDPHAIFTISVYDKASIDSFQDLITTRYGSSLLSTEQTVNVAGLEAKKVTAEFLNMGLTADMLVHVDSNIYVSLYGVQPAGENAGVQNEIDYMQNSFES